jgi:hypothetical protein
VKLKWPERDDLCIQTLVRKSGGKRSLRRYRPKWEDSIKVDIKEIETILTEVVQHGVVCDRLLQTQY